MQINRHVTIAALQQATMRQLQPLFDSLTYLFGRCLDYVHLYVDLERPEVAERATPSFSLCGNRTSLTQTKFYSSQRSLILEFHSDVTQKNYTGFRGIYRFIDKGWLTWGEV